MLDPPPELKEYPLPWARAQLLTVILPDGVPAFVYPSYGPVSTLIKMKSLGNGELEPNEPSLSQMSSVTRWAAGGSVSGMFGF